MTFDPEVLPVPDLGLLCRKCRYPLAGLGSHRCPECGKPFSMEEYIPPGDFPVLIFLGKEVRVEPKVIAMLKSVQVPYLEVLRPGETMMGQMGTVDTHGRIAVPRDNYFDVIDLLRRQALGEPPPVCNETVRADWQCAGCGEENPGNFDICWNCGHEAP